MSPIDPILLSFIILIVVFLGWQHFQLRSLGERLRTLERQHLALVEELETRLYGR